MTTEITDVQQGDGAMSTDPCVLAEQLVATAPSQGVELTGPGGLLTGLIKQVLETALETALGEHLGHERGERSGSGNVRNGSSAKALARFDDAVLSLHAKGITTGGIANHLADVYGTEVSRDLVSPVTDAVIEDMQESQSRPLDSWQFLATDANYRCISCAHR